VTHFAGSIRASASVRLADIVGWIDARAARPVVREAVVDYPLGVDDARPSAGRNRTESRPDIEERADPSPVA
jgi:hypothetical protein